MQLLPLSCPFVCPYVCLTGQYRATPTVPIFVTFRNDYMYSNLPKLFKCGSNPSWQTYYKRMTFNDTSPLPNRVIQTGRALCAVRAKTIKKPVTSNHSRTQSVVNLTFHNIGVYKMSTVNQIKCSDTKSSG